MADPFYGEIRTFGFSFAPEKWAHCNGQLLPISQNSALYSLLGINFGGDGYTNFGIPNLQGRVPMHYGTGNGLTPRPFAQSYGFEATTLTTSNLPPHNHDFRLSDGTGNEFTGNGNALSQLAMDKKTDAPNERLELFKSAPTFSNNFSLSTNTISNTGASQEFNNMQPYLALNFCIALYGLYPSRS